MLEILDKSQSQMKTDNLHIGLSMRLMTLEKNFEQNLKAKALENIKVFHNHSTCLHN